jgi:hypothetical protein
MAVTTASKIVSGLSLAGISREKVSIVTTALTGTVAINVADVTQGATIMYTSSSNAQTFVPNFTGANGATLGSQLAIGESVTITVMAYAGGTYAPYPSSFQVDGQSGTPISVNSISWQGGTAPSSSNITVNSGRYYVYTYTLVRTDATTGKLFASFTYFN